MKIGAEHHRSGAHSLRNPTLGVSEMKTIQQIQIFYVCGSVKVPALRPEKQERIKKTCMLLITHIRICLLYSAAAKTPLLFMSYRYLVKVSVTIGLLADEHLCWLPVGFLIQSLFTE